jgi:hypothetical protein
MKITILCVFTVSKFSGVAVGVQSSDFFTEYSVKSFSPFLCCLPIRPTISSTSCKKQYIYVLFVWHVFYFIFVEIIKTLYSILSYFLACNYIKARFYVKHILIIIKERNDQEKNNKHNQTQGGTNTIKMINVADRCFDRFD